MGDYSYAALYVYREAGFNPTLRDEIVGEMDRCFFTLDDETDSMISFVDCACGLGFAAEKARDLVAGYLLDAVESAQDGYGGEDVGEHCIWTPDLGWWVGNPQAMVTRAEIEASKGDLDTLFGVAWKTETKRLEGAR